MGKYQYEWWTVEVKEAMERIDAMDAMIEYKALFPDNEEFVNEEFVKDVQALERALTALALLGT